MKGLNSIIDGTIRSFTQFYMVLLKKNNYCRIFTGILCENYSFWGHRVETV